MVQRTYWQKVLTNALKRHSLVWLSGVRRAGKTYLCKSLPGFEYFDCELPSQRRRLEDPETFLNDQKGKKLILDEVHRLSNPSEILKIAADYYPTTKIIATGSSTLGASAKFRDTLAGRKSELWLTPMISDDLIDFRLLSLEHRFLQGGLPPFFMAKDLPEREFQEWVDAFWAKDIQELFRLERRHSFQKFLELLFVQSGGIFEASRFAQPCEVSRTTITNYLAVLEATFVIHIVRPFSTYRATEIVSAPKIYAFDTGFLCAFRNWQQLREQDLGILWEHYVLNEIHAKLQTRQISYWRDKRGHEVDFILPLPSARHPTAIECKWKFSDFDPKNLLTFRKNYPTGRNLIVTSDTKNSYSKHYNDISLKVVALSSLVEELKSAGKKKH